MPKVIHMSIPKFSIVIPVYSELEPLQSGASGSRHFRAQTVQRAIKSIIAQQFPHWELIVVDDGSVDGVTPAILDKFAKTDERIKIIHQSNEGRSAARNKGMEEATGEWLCWLDSDDEYSTHYLRELNQAIKDFPEYNLFNFGSIIYFPDHYTAVRGVFRPLEEGEGHEWFSSGGIGAGSFIFKRDLWSNNQDKYRIPDVASPYQFAAESRIPMRWSADEPDRENPTEAFQDGVVRHGSSLGNPFGDDYCQFYYLTRDNKSKPLDVLLYIQYPRAHEEVYEHFGEIYDTI